MYVYGRTPANQLRIVSQSIPLLSTTGFSTIQTVGLGLGISEASKFEIWGVGCQEHATSHLPGSLGSTENEKAVKNGTFGIWREMVRIDYFSNFGKNPIFIIYG